jgi:hypothetical protein
MEACVITTDIALQQVTHTATGETTLTQVTEAMQRWYDHPDFDPDRPVLWDLREADLSPPKEDLAAWAEHNRAVINALRPGRKTAWVFPSPEAAEFAVDMLGAFDWAHRVRIFNNDIEAAAAWLESTIR